MYSLYLCAYQLRNDKTNVYVLKPPDYKMSCPVYFLVAMVKSNLKELYQKNVFMVWVA